MKSAGGLLLLLGIGSVALYFFNMEFRLLAWIDMWGAEMGWVIRIVLILAGGGLLAADKFMGGEETGDAGEAEAPTVSHQAAPSDPQPGTQSGTPGESQYGSHGHS